MTEGLVSAATGAMQPVLGKLDALLGDEYTSLRSIHAEIESLTLDLQAMDALLEKMYEAEDLDPLDKAWMKELRELSYDVEDKLDEFTARVVADHSAKPDGFMDKIKTLLEKAKARHEVAKAIEDLKKQAIEVSHSNKRRKSGASDTTSLSKIDHRALAISEKLVGVDGPKKELLHLLGDCESTQQQTKLVAIVGFRGLGKTTIANQVYQELEGQFQYRAFLSVSQDPDMTRVMNAIYAKLIGKSSPGTEVLQTTIRNIRDFLQNERYLIMVDGIGKLDEWDVIKSAFPRTTTGSKIIITTRINAVAESCCSSFSGHIYNLRPLTMMQSRELLNTRLYNSEEKCSSDIEEVSSKILEKCAGLPPAIIAISGVLASKTRTKDQWEQVKDSVSRALRNSGIETMVNIISLSYLDLAPNLRTCLLYLSIFPKDHNIEKDNLIRRWISERFIQNRTGSTVYESGEMCFNELINRSLIEPAEIDKKFGGHEVKSCRVPAMVFDFIVSKAIDENFVTVISSPAVINPDQRNKARRLSLQNDGEIPPGLHLTDARSLHVFGRNVKIPALSQFQLLRVMDFEDCSQLEDDDLEGIDKLLHLKYLRFKNANSVTKLPEELAMLQSLEIYIHGRDKIMEIPENVQRLVSSVALYLDGFDTVPDEMAAVQGLRVLEGLSVYTQSTEFLGGLGQLKNLRRLGVLFMISDCDDDWEEKQEKAASSICELGKAELESLHIYIHETADDIFAEEWFPGPPCGLWELVIEGDSLTMVPEWMASLVNLEKLQLPMKNEMSEEDVKILGGLPCLRHLCIQCVSFDDEVAPELEAAVQKAMEEHPNRPTLVWTYVSC